MERRIWGWVVIGAYAALLLAVALIVVFCDGK